jgi:integrase
MASRQITRVEVRKFAATLKWRSGKNKGQNLSRSRIDKIIFTLRAIWNDACDEHQWDLPDPFRFLSKHLPKRTRRPFEVFRFDEWMRIVQNFDPAYRNTAEIMMMTGMIASEIAGLRREDIHENKIHIVNSISRKREKPDLKTPYRIRTFPITNAVRERVDMALANAVGKYLFSAKYGGIFEAGKFRMGSWRIALEKAGVPYRKPYITRHTFAAWSLAIGLDKNRLVSLMGHGSKQMIYEVYGKYVEGLEKDSGKILDYFGRDFVGLPE